MMIMIGGSAIRAKNDLVVGPAGASEGARLVVLREAIRVGTPVLEEPREVCGPTASAAVLTAILVGLEHRARVVAPARGPQLPRALPVYVRRAQYSPAGIKDPNVKNRLRAGQNRKKKTNYRVGEN